MGAYSRECCETAWYGGRKGVCLGAMGHCKGKDNVRKRAARRKKTERLALAKSKAKTAK